MPTNQVRDVLVAGPRDPHAIENRLLGIMKPQVKRVAYPEVAAKLQRYLTETEDPIRRLEDVRDEILKTSFAKLAFENFEIAAYLSLLTVIGVSLLCDVK